jgi:four helix bundle protein
MTDVEFAEQFKKRTKLFALRIIKLFQALPKTEEAKIIGKQLLRSATSVAANYRAACRARSKAEFYSKLSIVIEEADESLFWIEILIEANILPESKLLDIKQEITEIVSVVAKARKTLNQ